MTLTSRLCCSILDVFLQVLVVSKAISDHRLYFVLCSYCQVVWSFCQHRLYIVFSPLVYLTAFIKNCELLPFEVSHDSSEGWRQLATNNLCPGECWVFHLIGELCILANLNENITLQIHILLAFLSGKVNKIAMVIISLFTQIRSF